MAQHAAQYCPKLMSDLTEQELVKQTPHSVLSCWFAVSHLTPYEYSELQLVCFLLSPSVFLSLSNGHFLPPTREYRHTEAHLPSPHAHTHPYTVSLTHTIAVGKATWYSRHSWIFIHTCFRQKVFRRFHCRLDRSLDLISFVCCKRVRACVCVCAIELFSAYNGL